MQPALRVSGYSPDFVKTKHPVLRFVRENGLSLAILGLFLVSIVGHAIAGHAVYNADAAQHGRAAMSQVAYLTSGHFVESVFENWESEFLQMGLFVALTIFLRQKGSSESKTMGEDEEVDDDPRKHANEPLAPWPVRRGGLALKLYENSLCIALFSLFAVSFGLHAVGGFRVHNAEQLAHGAPRATFLEYLGDAQFWFESFQNWQSEFLSVFALVVLSIFLRQKGSPQSKPVHAPHAQTGE